MKKLLPLILLLFLCINSIWAQFRPETVADLDELLGKKEFDQIDKIVKQRVAGFFQAKNIDTLRYYVSYMGKAATMLRGPEIAEKEIVYFLDEAKKTFPYAKELPKIFMNATDAISNQGNHQLSYKIIEELDIYFLSKRNLIQNDLASLYYIMGDFASRMANHELAKQRYQQSMEFSNQNSNSEKSTLVKTYFAFAMMAYNSSKYDSALFYGNKAIEVLDKIGSDIYKLNPLAVVQNYMGSINNAIGNNKEAIKYYELAIQTSKKFIASTEAANSKKEQAQLTQLYAIGNLGTLYLENSNLGKAHAIYEYFYDQVVNRFGENDFETARALLFLGIVANERHQYQKAKEYSKDALNKMVETGNGDGGWAADAYAQVAIAYHNLKQNDSASYYYEAANKIQKKINTTGYDKQYFYFRGLLSDFYSATGQSDKAIAISNEGLQYLTKTLGENSIRTVRMLNALVIAQYHAGRYAEAEKNSKRGIATIRTLLAQATDPLDSTNIEKDIPTYILYKTKSSYQLLKTKDEASIKALLAETDEAMEIFEKKRTNYTDEDGIGGLLTEYKELIDFIKHLNYELLKLSANKKYIDDIINIHERSVYTRIRSRLDKQKATLFTRLPESVSQQEAAIKTQMETALQGEGSSDEKIGAYMQALTKWNEFQQTLKSKYPDYYNMRYGGINISTKDLEKVIPNGLTVVRYIFSDKELFALVATNKKQNFIPLSSNDLSDKVKEISDPSIALKKSNTLAHDLYQQLWKPLEKDVVTKRVIVIPDGILYNLSFEMLTPVVTNSIKEFSQKCLLNQYAISYHYSLLALQAQRNPVKMKSNFVAFAPGFSDKTKQQYSSVAKNDSLHLDRAYLSLIPLPFTDQLVNKVKQKFGGNAFFENQSTPEAFRKQSGNNRIIHIGTHAEANNDFPEYSRLIFSKDQKDITAENSVYLFDIYNCNLTSDLAVLTACETGKPGFFPGEGMVSMAHAFNYAGSESILTGLWKIDEQSSTIITQLFYDNLAEGMTKDEALQQAKIKYLETADGRMLSPQYWAGLVIMGDTSPIELKKKNILMQYWWIGALLIISVTGGWWWMKKKK